MDPKAYRDMAEVEARHWWFAGRRVNLTAILATLSLPNHARILEIGAGTGGNLDMLAGFGKVTALEIDAQARGLAGEKTGGRYRILAGSCPDDLPFAGETFDLVCLLDSLEHIEADAATLRAVHDLLAPSGKVILTVPAHPWLWSAHDVFLHHKRRYRRNGLRTLCSATGFTVQRLSYFNFFLFPLAVAARMKDQLFKSPVATGAALPAAPVNALFRTIFAAERFLLPHMNLPAGVSLLAVLEAA